MNFTFLILALMYQCSVSIVDGIIHGRYTKSLKEYHLAVPHKLTADGDFSTFLLPHFYDHSIKRFKERKKRTLNDPELIHYGVSLNGNEYHLELWPNRAFLHPNLVFEKRDPTVEIKDRHVRGLSGKKLCQYTGRVRGISESKAALSTCDGLAGYIVIGGKKYFIEPVDQHSPNSDGHHLHVVHSHNSRENKLWCGTQELWEDAIKRRFKEQALDGKDIFLEKRGLESVHRYLELTVVCDKKFLHYHQTRDVELYVMTVMNMVSDYYHDASVGNQMDIVIVRIIYLEKEEHEIDLEINRDSGKTLRSFCDWALKVNTPKDTPNHHDMALLLTRYDLCADAENDCDLTGLAYLGGACSKNEQCGINEDAGLVLAVITAHEIGHLMGADHDEQATACAVKDSDGSYFVMSPIVSTYTIKWSSCSRSMITALLDNNLGECLDNVPESTPYIFSDNMPGVVYDADAQCRFTLPASLGVCGGLKEKICDQLICKMSKKECIGKGEVPADGTKCGENKWCFRKQCIEMGARPEAVNGGWGDWGSWSDCSRSCGGGISSSDRDCNNPVPANKGRYCLGERRKVKICHTEACPEDAPNFRQQQCTEEDSKPWGDEYHTWTASFEEDKPCALYCINEQNVVSKLKPAVKDGTPCKPGTKNMCVSGVCKVVGCDNVIDSEAVEDHCGVCNGDGTQCKIIEETYNDVGQGYAKVVVIPTGARKVVIQEKAPSNNMIAISDSSEKNYFLNKDYTEFQDGLQNLGKVEGVYSHTEPNMEKLVINGPLREDLVLFVVFFDPENVGYTYKWAEPSMDSSYEPHYHWEIVFFDPENVGYTYKWAEPSMDSSYEPHYHWEIGEFADCSAVCGGGTQVASSNCMEEKSGKVSANFCAGIDKPKDTVKNCKEEPCQKRWKVGVYGPCRACKNKGGVRTRQVECVQNNPKRGADDILIEDQECEGPKPGTVELCTTTEKCGIKRMTSYIPGKYQESIWSQMNKKRIRKEDQIPSSTTENPLKTTMKAKITISKKYDIKNKLGKLVHDFRPIEEEVLYRYTVASNPMGKNLSDESNAQMGDQIGDVIDTRNGTVLKGKVAAILKHKMEHPSKEVYNITCHKKGKKTSGPCH